jgi:hypothetical protein
VVSSHNPLQILRVGAPVVDYNGFEVAERLRTKGLKRVCDVRRDVVARDLALRLALPNRELLTAWTRFRALVRVCAADVLKWRPYRNWVSLQATELGGGRHPREYGPAGF